MKLEIFAEIRGSQQKVGEIETALGGEHFTYSESWRDYNFSRPLSLSMPVADTTYSSRQIRPYFEGLLPEEGARSRVAEELGISSGSYLRLLKELGDECIGAVMVREIDPAGNISSQQPEPRYERLEESALQETLSNSYEGTSVILAETRLSIAGAQAKVGLYRKPDDTKEWYLPHGTAPASHILKPHNGRFPNLALNECLCLSTARKCGLSVPNAFLIGEEYPALVIERFDRKFQGAEKEADGCIMPLRLHQEDFCQALGILSSDKYERGSGDYLARIALVIRESSQSPITDLKKLCDILIFNYLIGNCDNHLKNLSLLYNAEWTQVGLAPSYDLANTTTYRDLSRTMGISIGATQKIDSISRNDFVDASRQLGISQKIMLSSLDEMLDRFFEAIQGEADKLSNEGYLEATVLGKSITADLKRRVNNVMR